MSIAPYAFRIKLRAVNVENKDMGGLQRSDPFLVVNTRPYGMNRHIRIYQTEVRHNTRTAEWGEFILEMASCGGWDSDIFFEVWDYDSFNKNDFIGRAKTTIREMLAFKNLKPEMKIINPRKKGNLAYWDSGILHIDIMEPMNPPQNYIVPRNFTAINFVVPHGFDDELFSTMTTVSTMTGPTPLGVHPVTGMSSSHLGVHPQPYGQPQPQPYGTQPQHQPQHQPQPSPYGQPQTYGGSQSTLNYGGPPHQPQPYGSTQPQPSPYGTQPHQPYGGAQPNHGGNPYASSDPNPYGTHQPQPNPYGAPQNPYSTGQPQPNPYGGQPQQPYGTQQPYASQQQYGSQQPYGYGQQPGY